MDGIIDVTRVKMIQKTGANYSNEIMNIESSYSSRWKIY